MRSAMRPEWPKSREDPHEKNNIIEQLDEEEIKTLRNDLLAWEAQVRASYEQRRQDEETTSSE